MIVSIPRETLPGENRVAIVPAVAAALAKSGHTVQVERGAGVAAGFTDAEYEARNAKIIESRRDLVSSADLIVQVRTLGANPEHGNADVQWLAAGQVLIGFSDPLSAHESIRTLAERGVTLLAMELIPRITRAQSMDALSSQANLAGYRAVILAAEALQKIFPMMMTAAGTLQPGRVFVIGAGVAGLQAIATAKRLGAVVSAFDVRPAVKEQVESLGAKFVQLPLDTANLEDKGGYAKAQSEEQVRKQQELMAKVVAESDVVITTALIPGKPAPKLVTSAMVEGMSPGSIIVDLAAERGGNCELTRPGETYVHNHVTIIGDDNPASKIASHASLMYANNIANLLKSLMKEGRFAFDPADEITAATLVCRDGQVVHPRVKEAMGMG